MNCTHGTERVHACFDGELSPADTRAVEAHIAGCARCRAEFEALRALHTQTMALPREIAPQPDLWSGIRHRIASGEMTANVDDGEAIPDSRRSIHPRRFLPATDLFLRWFAPLAIAALTVLFASFAERSLASRTAAPGWLVAAVAGAPRVGTQTVHHEATFRVGQWLETDAASRAKVAVGSIGEVNVEPNSRLRLVDVAASDHRLELARGTLNAFIWAPPRLFFVDTPSATAVDLGCAYTLTVDDTGNGELHVTSGYVALEDGDRESIIGAGMMCLTRRGMGPGTPFASDAPAALRAALTRFDFDRASANAALPDVLAHARPEDAVTLWHLLGRTQGAQCAAVFEALTQYTAPPSGVTREGILNGDVPMRRAWAAELGLHPY